MFIHHKTRTLTHVSLHVFAIYPIFSLLFHINQYPNTLEFFNVKASELNTMAMKTKLSLAIFLLALLCSNLAIAREETDPELETCIHQCKQQRQYDQEDKRICMDKCEDYHRMKQERERHKEREREHAHEHEREREHEHEQEDESPYVFEDRDFDIQIDTEDGRVMALNMFDQKSKLLRNFENYGLTILEAKGHAFVSPHHFDSEVIFFNVKGMY